MTAMREIYVSGNGDTWHLLWDFETGHTFVRHTANKPSGGNIVDISLPVFLSLGRDGPEHQALWAMIGTLLVGHSSNEETGSTPSPEAGAAAPEPSPGKGIL
ncbi:hypothetical protein [Methylobacterium thuringiense]|uniref:Uncharacterized protein n=1 Tax=Methylobacterium thuringiense TaxID=1003091 RepID=A0ABQ4TUY5_9HYPH|nr:hypothetical protein [Methylobacterium thuringiense]GJE57772.1 hypothetical protein EKPJFOCH_4291 [Methylobacterium thuringiense]